jgi:hypothetical protein
VGAVLDIILHPHLKTIITMANMCYNYVTCTGSAESIAKLKQSLLDGREHIRTHYEAADLGVDLQEGAFFDIEISDDTDCMLQFSYETKYAPNLKDLAEVCKMHNVTAVIEYDECGFQVYGKATITPDGLIDDDEVPTDFLELIEYIEDEGCYEYNGIQHETIGDAINEHYPTWKESQSKTTN